MQYHDDLVRSCLIGHARQRRRRRRLRIMTRVDRIRHQHRKRGFCLCCEHPSPPRNCRMLDFTKLSYQAVDFQSLSPREDDATWDERRSATTLVPRSQRPPTPGQRARRGPRLQTATTARRRPLHTTGVRASCESLPPLRCIGLPLARSKAGEHPAGAGVGWHDKGFASARDDGGGAGV